MNVEESVTLWIEGLREGHNESAQLLWERYFQQLVTFAGSKLPRGVRRVFDEEDVALSAFHSLCKGVQNGRFPKLDDRDNLWSLLVVITARKAIRNIRVATAQKRGSGRVLGESALDASTPSDANARLDHIIGKEPTEEFAQLVSEECEHLLSLLPDAEMRKLALMKMEGCDNKEVSRELGYGVRTIERRLGLLRRIWQDRGEE